MSAAQIGVSLIPLVVVSLGVGLYYRLYLRGRPPRPMTMRSLWMTSPFALVFIGTAWAYAIRKDEAPGYVGAVIVTVVWVGAFVIGYRRRRNVA